VRPGKQFGFTALEKVRSGPGGSLVSRCTSSGGSGNGVDRAQRVLFKQSQKTKQRFDTSVTRRIPARASDFIVDEVLCLNHDMSKENLI
jgi:hypothetical protein